MTLGLEVGTVGASNVRTLIPIKAEPSESLKNRLKRSLDMALSVGIVNSEDELPAVMSRKQPVKQSGANSADVKIAGWARGKACADSHE